MATTKTQDGGQKYGVTVQVAALLVITMQYVQSFVTPGLATVRAAYAGLGIDTVMIQQIQGILPDDGTLVRSHEHPLGPIDHLIEHVD